MYSNDKSAIKIDNILTESFPCFAGVKQGCMLSPTLFNLCLSDLPKFLNTASPTDIMLGDKSINCLLYADDQVIFSRSAKSFAKRNEMKSVLCEMKICTLRNENLYFAKWNLYFAKWKSVSLLCEMKSVTYFAKWKSVLCEMKICTLRNEICTLRNEYQYFPE